MSDFISDLSLRTLGQAMRGIDARRQAIQDNIANVETPGYLSNQVNFEDSLRQALKEGDPSQMEMTTARSLAPTNVNGNNVAIDQEFVNLSQNQLAGQLVVEAVNAKYRLLRTSIAGTA